MCRIPVDYLAYYVYFDVNKHKQKRDITEDTFDVLRVPSITSSLTTTHQTHLSNAATIVSSSSCRLYLATHPHVWLSSPEQWAPYPGPQTAAVYVATSCSTRSDWVSARWPTIRSTSSTTLWRGAYEWSTTTLWSTSTTPRLLPSTRRTATNAGQYGSYDGTNGRDDHGTGTVCWVKSRQEKAQTRISQS